MSGSLSLSCRPSTTRSLKWRATTVGRPSALNSSTTTSSAYFRASSSLVRARVRSTGRRIRGRGTIGSVAALANVAARWARTRSLRSPAPLERVVTKESRGRDAGARHPALGLVPTAFARGPAAGAHHHYIGNSPFLQCPPGVLDSANITAAHARTGPGCRRRPVSLDGGRVVRRWPRSSATRSRWPTAQNSVFTILSVPSISSRTSSAVGARSLSWPA
jgi:hypothetical protein